MSAIMFKRSTKFMRSTNCLLSLLACASCFGASASLLAADNPFIGRWALTIPTGRAGWLGIEETNGQLHGSILWGGGSVVPLHSVTVAGDRLTLKRQSNLKTEGQLGQGTGRKSNGNDHRDRWLATPSSS